MYYVYIIRKDGRLYIGYSSNLEDRIKKHSTGHECKLLYYEAYSDKEMATKREWRLKQYGGAYRALKKRLSLE